MAMFARFGLAVVRARWVVIGAWAAVAVVGGVFGGTVFDRLSTVDNLSPAAESMVAERRIDQLVPSGPVVLAIVQGVHPYDPGLVASVTHIAGEVRQIDGVVDVDDLYTRPGGQIGADNNSSLVRVELVDHLPEHRLEAVEDAVAARLREIEAPRVIIGGDLAERAFAEQATSDAIRGESIAFVIVLAALVVVLGGLFAGSIPIAVALVAVATTLLGLLGLTKITTVSEYAVNVVTLLGIGLAVDYSLLIVSRYREELAGGRQRVDAIVIATERAGQAVLVSGLAVAASLAGLYAFAEPLLAAMALGGAVVVVLATAVALTLVPALIAVGHRWIRPAGNRPRFLNGFPFGGLRPNRGTLSEKRGMGLLARLATFAQRRPGPVALWVTVGLILLAAPFLGANLANSDARALPRSMEARQAYEAVRSGFTDQRPTPVTVVAEVDAGAPAVRTYLNELDRLSQLARLQLRMDVPAGTTIIDLTPRTEPDSRVLVREVRAMSPPFRVLVSGPAAELVDYQESVARRLPVAAIVVLLATAILLFALTNSVVVPVKALVMNLLTLAATLGVLIVAFQWGWARWLLGFEPWGGIDLTTPVLLFVFLFGLSMDYEVFLLARIKEEWDRTGDNNRAILAGIAKSGRVVTSAALCIGIVFLGFVLGDLTAVKEIGFGMAVAVLLDVTVVRGLLLPAVMTLLGERNWWAPWWLRSSRPLRRADPEPPLSDVRA